jgi:2-polyprenyl-3-methyl-5-hydroxy-6-metoxy-1,4-benzoquinol methylase
MDIIYKKVISMKNNITKQKVLDIPAGNGKLSEALEKEGFNVISADINDEKEKYVYANMEKELPFADNEFDIVICAEGIEHVIDPYLLIREFTRITKNNGYIIVTTPNIQNCFSRVQFFCTGYFYQFHPSWARHNPNGEEIDRGHISPMSYLQLRYLFEEHNCKINEVQGSRYKKMILLPLYLPFLIYGKYWIYKDYIKGGKKESKKEIMKDLFSIDMLFGRSLIMTFHKENIALTK